MRFATVLCLILVCTGATVATNDWPGFRGPSHTGAVATALGEDGPVELTVGWRTQLGSGYSAVAVADGRVVTMFAGEDADFVAAYDASSGQEIWRHRIGDTYAGHDGSHDGPISTPAIAGGRVFGLGPWGDLFAVDLESGKELWRTHLVDDHGASKPYYGFTTSPLVADGVLIVELSAPEPEVPEGEEPPEVNPDGKAVAGFDPESGKLLWTAGDDVIEYHSPIVAQIAGDRQLLVAGQKRIYALDPTDGTVEWSYEHDGDGRAMGGMSIVPVPAGPGRVLLMNKQDSSIMLRVERKKSGDYEITELWSGANIKASYSIPIYHDGYLYGMSGRIFVCVDAATGELVWRSREPGDGFPTLVGDRIVMMTKPGLLAVVEATPEEYRELARLELFDDHSWSEVAYAEGHLFARSMSELVRIDPSRASAADEGDSWIAETGFGEFLAAVESAEDKAAVVDRFMKEQTVFPIVEDSGVVTFLYRGPAQDVGIVGDMIGYRREDPMTRIDGTDLFHYTTRLEPDAAVAYGFIVDYADEPVVDSLNPQSGESLFGEVSWLTMPAWRGPDFLEAPVASDGRLEELSWTSEIQQDAERIARVYLPPDYDEGERRYPVLYVHNGQDALDQGRWKDALDRLVSTSVQPVIAVFLVADEENRRLDRGPDYERMVVEELVPMVDETFRTIAEPGARASVGAGGAALGALAIAVHHPDVFGRVASQSATPFGDLPFGEEELDVHARPLVVYLEWGTYHLRSPHEAWDMADANRELWNDLREAGYRPAGGEVPEGFGWRCWMGHTDELLTAMFPMRQGPSLAAAAAARGGSEGQ
jgi:enterochelin esterase-like enzyme/outer membrane protein assembly factor BamB